MPDPSSSHLAPGLASSPVPLLVLRMGVDLVHIPRIQSLLDRHADRFLSRVFTPQEQRYCLSYTRPAPHLAARFAAKEAALKALSTGLSAGIAWTDVSVLRSPAGEPSLLLTARALEISLSLGVTASLLSLSHTDDHAIATVLLGRRA